VPESRLLTFLEADGMKLLYASQLPKPPRAASTESDKGRAQHLVFDADASDTECSSNYWSVADEDFSLEEGGYYVPLARYNADGQHPRILAGLMRKFKAVGVNIDDMDIIGFKPSMLAKISGNSKWVPVKTELRRRLEDKLNDKTLIEQVSCRQQISRFEVEYPWLPELAKKIKSPEVEDVIAIYDSMVAKAAAMPPTRILDSLAEEFGMNPPPSEGTSLLDKAADFLVRHPLFGLVMYNRAIWERNTIWEEYVDVIRGYFAASA